MNASEAADYAPQWGSFMRDGDPGACMYGDPADASTARLMIEHIDSDCLPIAKAGLCCGESGAECESDVERLGELRAYLESVIKESE